MIAGFPPLSLVIWAPIAAGLLVLATGADRNAALARWLALAGSLVGFAVSIPLYTGFDPLAAGMQFSEMRPWIETFRINYHLGVDGIMMTNRNSTMTAPTYTRTRVIARNSASSSSHKAAAVKNASTRNRAACTGFFAVITRSEANSRIAEKL